LPASEEGPISLSEDEFAKIMMQELKDGGLIPSGVDWTLVANENKRAQKALRQQEKVNKKAEAARAQQAGSRQYQQ
jgi:hypothetical protein